MIQLVLKIVTKNGVLDNIELKQGVNPAIKATDNVNYLIVDKQTGMSPKEIKVIRQGKDLYVQLADNEVLILDYYQAENAHLIGLSDGSYYYYDYNVANQLSPIDSLVDKQVAGQHLGGQAQKVAWWEGASVEAVEASSMSATTTATATATTAGGGLASVGLGVAGALGVGVALAGGGGGGSDNTSDPSKPPTPKNNAPTDIALSNNTVAENAGHCPKQQHSR